MHQQRIDLKKLRAQISLQYGIELDETSLTILAILTQEMKRQFIKMDKAQDEMTTQIQHSKKALQVDHQHPRWQAFWHGMGQWGTALCLAVISALAIFSIDLDKERQEREQLQHQMEWYKEQYQAIQKQYPKTGTNTNKRKLKPKSKQ